MNSSFAALSLLGGVPHGRRALLGLLSVAGLAGSAMATEGRNPGSLLLYPEFDNRSGTATVVTVTNVQIGDEDPDVRVEFIYIGRFGPKGQDLICQDFNRTETLTPGDTFTALTNVHNPEHEQGFLYVFAKNNLNLPIVHNFLTGNVMTVDGFDQFEFSVNPVSYRGIGDGVLTDLDQDGHLDMNGCEYSTNPAEILIPRFFGQVQTNFYDELIMIGLSGGGAFQTKLDFLIFNDNEEIFSSEHTFQCWERTPLLDISNLFANDFLKNWTNDDPDELLGAPEIETGWIRIKGGVANSSTTSIDDPSVYCVLLTRVDSNRGAADLPFERGVRTNGELFPGSNAGDTTDFDCR
jgi:hypothetical protein